MSKLACSYQWNNSQYIHFLRAEKHAIESVDFSISFWLVMLKVHLVVLQTENCSTEITVLDGRMDGKRNVCLN